MDFYTRLEEEKTKKTFKIKDISEILHKDYDAVRMAIKRKSFSELEKKEIEKNIFSEQKSEQIASESNAKLIEIAEHKEVIPNKNGNTYEQLADGKYRIYVKKVSVKALGSYVSDFQDAEFYDDLQEVSFTVDHIGRGKYMCFEVKGDSMWGGGGFDAPEGAELLCRELGRQHWKDGFRESVYGWVIVHKDTVLYKDIKNFDPETGDIVCHSRSGLPQHPDFVINLNDVKQLWKVIKRSF